ncbi:butyrophilin subfamily 2 member A1-like, partial [Empidonax traillii]|uniref:butyrophilin subfamily 2 member A1-like n=1 Tax=Empidonax traillii TaxID=164674 RepID=UPI000FFDA7B6
MARPGSTRTTRSSRCSARAQVPQQTHTSLFLLRGSLPDPFHVTGPPNPITVAKGENVVLPCGFSPGQDALDTEVIWFREQFSPFVHRYKWGQDQYGEQMLQYQGCTELRKDGLCKGSADLKLFHVRPSDTGTYTCFVRRGSHYDEAQVKLKHPCFPLPLTCGSCVFFKAWRRHAVPIEEGNVVLDPDTAHCELVVSDNGKSVTRGDPREDIPYTPNRFDVWRCVLGRDGFTSGRHYWDVEVANVGEWSVGIFRENVERKGDIELKPEKGIWAVGKQAPVLKAFTSPHPIF